MFRKLIAVFIVMVMMAAIPAWAQNATSQSDMPAVAEVPEGTGQGGLLSGEKPFTLMVDENYGELVYEFDELTRELESINAKRGVIFASEDMTLNADEMQYQTVNSSLVAAGKRVVVRMGEMIITCTLFKYNPETQEGEFEGNPIVYQRNQDGQVTETAGRIISVVNVNGKFQMRVVGGGGTSTYVRSTGTAPEQGALEQRSLAPGQRGASMTINSNTVPGASASTSGASANNAGGLLGVPRVDSGTAPAVPSSGAGQTTGANAPAAPAATGQINPDNPADVQRLSE